MSIVLLGGGDHAKQVIDIFEEQDMTIEGIYDDYKTDYWYGYPILGTIKDLTDEKLRRFELFCCIGDNKIRRDLMYRFINRKWINCISTYARISVSSSMGVGNYIGGYTQILSDTEIGDGNILNEGAIVTHDIKMGHYNHIAPGVVVCGNVKIGDMNLIGANSSIIPKVIIGDNNIFGSGSVVNKSIESEGKYVGVPVRKIN